ncbi:MAG: hypothetical protein RBQ97_03480 [Acholeplasma sp.]|nr:hypothetical protein [Acholeplasma sp.]
MEIIKKILLYIVEPFHKFGSRGIADNASKFMSKKGYVIYILAFLIAGIVIYFSYFH